ncbi:substrate-binding domain-containing protein [Lysobacter antibioticus]|uniref:substrate-binding domain-containing protein n=1 Tax=Lysobacter antibioticus TaxID=84531 RepID=UPI003CE5825A
MATGRHRPGGRRFDLGGVARLEWRRAREWRNSPDDHRPGRACPVCRARPSARSTGAMRTPARHGLRIPEDGAVVGYDDVEISASLTTTRQDPVKAGRLLFAKALLAHEGHEPTSERLPTELIVRESCGA